MAEVFLPYIQSVFIYVYEYMLLVGVIHLWRPQKNRVFDRLRPPVRMRPHGPDPSSPRGRPYAVDMKYIPLSWNSWYNDLPDLKLKFDYMIIIYLNCTSSNLFYKIITNLYRRKMSTFFCPKTKFW